MKQRRGVLALKTPFISTVGALRIGSPGDPSVRPSTYLDGCSIMYIQKHFGQSVMLCGILWKDRSLQTKVQPGIAGHSRVKPGTARYSQVKPGTAGYSQAQPGTARISAVLRASLVPFLYFE